MADVKGIVPNFILQFEKLVNLTADASSIAGKQAKVPGTVILDGVKLAEKKALLRLGDRDAEAALSRLTAQANKWLRRGPWTVTSKKITPPGGDKHDYASQAPYWWPSATADGRPYIQRDGVRNPEAEGYTDHTDRGHMFKASYTLSLAWYYTENDAYAKHAGDILRTWFLSTDTRMNPNLNHAQIIPFADTGRAIGIIDFSQAYASVLDAAAILATGGPGWTPADVKGFHEWNIEFLGWLVNSNFGIKESAAKNNHGTFAIMIKAAIALFIGNDQLVKQELQLMKSRISDYISPNGEQPLELQRTRSWHYSIFNLLAYTNMAAIGYRVGIDIWSFKGPQGQSINGAIDFLIPAATGEAKWRYRELKFEANAASDVIHASADAGNPEAKRALSKLQAPTAGDFWELQPCYRAV